MESKELKKKHKLLHEWSYNWTALEKGYTDKVLYINLSGNDVKEKKVPELMKEKFIGGRGYGLKLLWDATKPSTRSSAFT